MGGNREANVVVAVVVVLISLPPARSWTSLTYKFALRNLKN